MKIINVTGIMLIAAVMFSLLCGTWQAAFGQDNGETKKIKIATEITNSIGMKFVLIPAGSFMMGCNSDFENCGSGEAPRHSVTITMPFYIGKYEVTQEQWTKVMGSNPSKLKGLSHPVEQVNWNDAQQLIKKLNAMENTNVYRLPTEAQWEYAARAGSDGKYCFGNDESKLGEYAWYEENSDKQTHPVGRKHPNAWGLYDMHGNVWEWVQDTYSENYYSSSPKNDPQGPSSLLAGRVLRGGSWFGTAGGTMRTAARFRLNAEDRYFGNFYGFRVVRSAQ